MYIHQIHSCRRNNLPITQLSWFFFPCLACTLSVGNDSQPLFGCHASQTLTLPNIYAIVLFGLGYPAGYEDHNNQDSSADITCFAA
jgi:hypothetical protein